MRTRFDQLAKEISRAILGPRAQYEVPVAVEAQAIDLWFEPDSEALALLSHRALLGRMASGPMSFEAFHAAPGDKDVQDCLRKHLALHHLRAKTSEDVSLARLWIVSAGRPRRVLDGLSMQPASDWPAGVYCGPLLMGVWIVVVSELPRTRETLALRLMGRGAVLIHAMEDFGSCPRMRGSASFCCRFWYDGASRSHWTTMRRRMRS